MGGGSCVPGPALCLFPLIFVSERCVQSSELRAELAAEEPRATGRKTDAPGAPNQAGSCRRVFTQQTLMKHLKVPSVVPGSGDSQRNKAWPSCLWGRKENKTMSKFYSRGGWGRRGTREMTL